MKRRRVTNVEVTDWLLQAAMRPAPFERESVLLKIKARNSYRLWRIQHDMKWLRKEVKRLGYDPELAKELL